VYIASCEIRSRQQSQRIEASAHVLGSPGLKDHLFAFRRSLVHISSFLGTKRADMYLFFAGTNETSPQSYALMIWVHSKHMQVALVDPAVFA
jgi:hypothetical protein